MGHTLTEINLHNSLSLSLSLPPLGLTKGQSGWMMLNVQHMMKCWKTVITTDGALTIASIVMMLE